MEDAPKLRVGNVLLGVRDMDRAVAFYRDALGLPVQFGSEEFTFLDGGGVGLVLHRMRDLPDAPEPRRSEVVLHVEDIDAAHRELGRRGVAFRIQPRLVTGQSYAADFRDPDGHVLSIFGPRPAPEPTRRNE